MKKLRSTLRIVVAAAALATAMALGHGQAQANHVSCGDTITADTTLDSDLVDCPSNGIVIGADDVALDLDGHTVDGDGTEFGGCTEDEFCDVGLFNDGHDGVTVTDGSVGQFAFGVFVLGARENRVLDISSSENALFGFLVAESARSVVRDSSGSDNPAPDGDGLGLFGSHRVRIVDNSFRHNPLGIHLEDSAGNLIKGNRISRNLEFGILMQGDHNQVRGNRCAGNIACVIVAPGSRNVIAGNRILRGEAGIGIEKGRGNVVARNVVVRAGVAGIYLGLKNPPIGGSNSLVRRNLVRRGGGDGFLVRETDADSRLTRNVAIGVGDDGFQVESRTATLTGNRALLSADLGIAAVPGVIDGGGNLARDNGDPRQCVHISCG